MALHSGFGRTLINPPAHIPAGTWMAQKHVCAAGIDIDLRSTALVLSDGPLSVALIDLCFLSDKWADTFLRVVQLRMETFGDYCPTWERGPELALGDVRELKVSVARGRERYGVAIDARLRGFDSRETANLYRERRRRAPDDA